MTEKTVIPWRSEMDNENINVTEMSRQDNRTSATGKKDDEDMNKSPSGNDDEEYYELFGLTVDDGKDDFDYYDETPSADVDNESRFSADQLHDIGVFNDALNGLYRLVENADHQVKVEFFRKNISVLRTIAHNSTGLLAYDEREPDDLLYATALVIRKSYGISLIDDLVDEYGDLDVWDYVPD